MPATDPGLKLEIKGLKELQKKAEQVARDLRGTKMFNAMRRATLLVQRHAKINSPVDTGRLRASITPEVRVEGVKMTTALVRGFVGSNVAYAAAVEFGARGGRGALYLTRAITDNMEKIGQILEDAVADIVEE